MFIMTTLFRPRKNNGNSFVHILPLRTGKEKTRNKTSGPQCGSKEQELEDWTPYP